MTWLTQPSLSTLRSGTIVNGYTLLWATKALLILRTSPFNPVHETGGRPKLHLFLEIKTTESIKMFEFGVMRLETLCLSGRTIEGYPVDFSGIGPLLSFSSEKNSNKFLFIYIFNKCVIGKYSFSEDSKIGFDVVNFLFQGPSKRITTQNGFTTIYSDEMEIVHASRKFVIKQIPNYERIAPFLCAQKGIEVTCKISANVVSKNIEDEVVTYDHLCEFMSIARATLINWISFEIRKPNDELVMAEYLNSVTRNFLETDLIDREDYLSTKKFLELCLSNYEKLSQFYSFRHIARAFTETRGGPFVETRAMLIAIMVEQFANTEANKYNLGASIDKPFNNQKWKNVEAKIKEIMSDNYPVISEEKISGILSEVKRSLIQSSYRERVAFLLAKIGLETNISTEEIIQFVKIRNSLVHAGAFPQEDSPKNYFFKMQHFLERIILKLVEYDGIYNDIEHHNKQLLK